MTPTRFLETNIFIRHITGDNIVQSPQSTALLGEMADGTFDGLTSMTVLFEVAFVLERLYQMNRIEIAESFLEMLETPGLSLLDVEREYVDQTLALYMSISQLSFADCYHATLSLARCDGEIYTYDQDFDRVPDLKRLEPGAIPESPGQPAPHPE